MNSLIVIPTYNEKENIPLLLNEILAASAKASMDVEVLVVDDNSPDGTGQIVKNFGNQKVHLLHREKKQGLGKAYLAGFAWALQKDYDVVFEMDADFSHRPADLINMLQNFSTHDFVLGSRYIAGGATKNWGVLRKIISRGGGLYSRLILGFPVQDWTGGFNGWKRHVLQGIGLQDVQSEGYSFQIELKYRALKNGFKGKEIPILFEDRRVGQSKMSLKIVLEAFYRVWAIRFNVRGND